MFMLLFITLTLSKSYDCGTDVDCTMNGVTLIVSGRWVRKYRRDYNRRRSYIHWEDSFSNCKFLTKIAISTSVTSIGNSAFYSCTSLSSIDISNNIISIGDYAFEPCTSLTKVNIGNSVSTIGEYAFYNCMSLTSIDVDTSNPSYSSLDGVLYNKDKTLLIQYPIGNSRTSYSIPPSVTVIGESAFWHCTSLTSINIPDSVTEIDDFAFESCITLTCVSYEGTKEITNIGKEIFGFSSINSIHVPDNYEKDTFATYKIIKDNKICDKDNTDGAEPKMITTIIACLLVLIIF
ncbi:hypothetical protein, conserved [Entamoeba dispar SAW760]|uniref:Surface antigen BspA-like n=1 Tax=Entamoeba dispar (strain ATCC PRA-260 / SAW760) TaxID=370354 RepID=B0EAD7_ENTDS|nr:uncharacterized protein EDI_194330 [Entamoeba dispar SAW760]EDR28522.1 hypothetical protein, conserved [Entamoeba dispar SAW760]|eukprot:EDR28522.1 hypothetical protein, conserved [Entamoeba dispar SAW760]